MPDADLADALHQVNVATATISRASVPTWGCRRLSGRNGAARISNSRKVLEAVLQQIAAVHSEKRGAPLKAEVLERAARVRDYLEEAKILGKKEKDAIASIYGLLSETGGHPHIAHRDQARLMRHLALTFSQFVLLRFQGLS